MEKKLKIKNVAFKMHERDCIAFNTTPNHVQCDCATVENINKFKYSSIVLDSKMTLKYHGNELAHKLKICLFKFNPAFPLVTFNKKKN